MLMFWYLQANGIESNRIEWVRGKFRIKRSLTLAYYKFWPIHTHTHTFPVKYTRVKTFLGQHIFELGILGSVWLHFFCTPPPPFHFCTISLSQLSPHTHTLTHTLKHSHPAISFLQQSQSNGRIERLHLLWHRNCAYAMLSLAFFRKDSYQQTIVCIYAFQLFMMSTHTYRLLHLCNKIFSKSTPTGKFIPVGASNISKGKKPGKSEKSRKLISHKYSRPIIFPVLRTYYNFLWRYLLWILWNINLNILGLIQIFLIL